jgi:hypothetical protein
VHHLPLPEAFFILEAVFGAGKAGAEAQLEFIIARIRYKENIQTGR